MVADLHARQLQRRPRPRCRSRCHSPPAVGGACPTRLSHTAEGPHQGTLAAAGCASANQMQARSGNIYKRICHTNTDTQKLFAKHTTTFAKHAICADRHVEEIGVEAAPAAPQGGKAAENQRPAQPQRGGVAARDPQQLRQCHLRRVPVHATPISVTRLSISQLHAP